MVCCVRTLVAFIILTALAHAVDGEIYVGKFGSNTSRAYPDGGVGKFISGIEIGQQISRFKPYLRLETISDRQNGDGTFHPASIRYDTGMNIDIWNGIFFEVKHSCWHPVDRSGKVEQYNLFLLKYRFGQ